MKLRCGFVSNSSSSSFVTSEEWSEAMEEFVTTGDHRHIEYEMNHHTMFKLMPNDTKEEIIKKMKKPLVNDDLFNRYQNDILDLEE